jgi:hypothetical protein
MPHALPRQGYRGAQEPALLGEAKALAHKTFAVAWTLARLRREIEARAGMTVTTKYVEGVLQRALERFQSG